MPCGKRVLVMEIKMVNVLKTTGNVAYNIIKWVPPVEKGRAIYSLKGYEIIRRRLEEKK